MWPDIIWVWIIGYDIGYDFDVIGYASMDAENYDCLISSVGIS